MRRSMLIDSGRNQHVRPSMLSNISYYSACTSTEINMLKMSHLCGAALLLMLFTWPVMAAEERHLLYFTTPDGAQGGYPGWQDAICAVGVVGREGSSLDGGGWAKRGGG